MPNPLPVPSPTITGWTPPSPPRPQAARTQSYIGRHHPQPPEPSRPFTAPSSQSTRRTPPRLPSLASITEQQESSRPGSSSLTLPAMRDTRDMPMTPGLSTSPNEYYRRQGSNIRSSSSYSERIRFPARPSTSAESSISIASPTGNYYTSSESSFGVPQTPEQPRLTLPHATTNYSRVLVGSLCSTCQLLHDETGRQGLFFFAHDLGVRTEGTFTLRFTLVNLTA